MFVVDGDFGKTNADDWPGFRDTFRVLQQSERQLAVAAKGQRDPADCLKALLALPITVENVALKRPSLNAVFLQLTGRALRE